MSSYAYNPFTSNLDLVGSGASYIDGVVATPASLPVTLNTPPLDSVFLAKAGSGVWLINRRPAGLYVRVANNGVAADWTYLGAFPEVNADGNWELYNSADPTKELKFDLSGLATGTTRTITVPNKNITLDDASDARTPTAHNHAASAITSGVLDNARINFAAPSAIGSTTPSTGAFTTLSANNGTITASAPVLSLSQTWNNAATTFTGLQFDVTNTASATSSLVARFTIGSTNVFETDVRGFTTLRKVATSTDFVDIFTVRRGTTKVFGVRDDGATQAASFSCSAAGDGASNMNSNGFGVRSSGSYSISSDSAAFSPDVFLRRDAAGIFAQYNAANPQAYRIYSTFSSTTSFERLNIAAQTGGNFIIGTEKGSGGGLARALEFRTDNTARLTIGSGGGFTLADAQDIAVGTTTGTKIGTGTTQKIGFFNATPVVQPAAVADATDAATVITQLNALLSRLRTIGLIAT